jgi:TolB-like protein
MKGFAMHHKGLTILLFIGGIIFAKNPAPDWVSDYGVSKDYPKEFYLTGFGSASGDSTGSLQIAKDNARADLIRSITVRVNTLLSTSVESRDNKYTEYFSSVIQSSAAMQLDGVQIETFVAKKGNNSQSYAFAFIKKSELRRIYSEKRDKLVLQINRAVRSAEIDTSNISKEQIVEKYLGLMPNFEELKETETVLLATGSYSSMERGIEDLRKRKSGGKNPGAGDVSMTAVEVSARVDSLMTRALKNTGDVARSLVYKLNKQLPKDRLPMMVTPFTYRDTRMTSPFGRQLMELLQTLFPQAEKNQITVRTRGLIKPKTTVIIREQAEVSGAKWVLGGSCWDAGNHIRLAANVREAESGRILAGAEAMIDTEILSAEGIAIKPQDFEAAMAEKKAFAKGEIVSGRLMIEAWTNKGNENVLFTKGETMKLYVRVNRPAHLRAVYKLADNRYTLLLDDYYIDESKVNQAVEIPEEFECGGPFGVERLIVIARTTRFDNIPIKEIDGYKIIETIETKDPSKIAEDAGIKVRGMKVKEKVEIEQNETSVVVTTMTL